MKIAVYSGTFDPVTNGHLSVLERGPGFLTMSMLRWRGKTIRAISSIRKNG